MPKYQRLKRKLLVIIIKNRLPLQNLTTQNFSARLAQTNLVTKTYFDTKLTSLSKKINSD